jgi:hypothetical protein
MKPIPPSSCNKLLHSKIPSEKLFISRIVVAPLVVSADIISKRQSTIEISWDEIIKGNEAGIGTVSHENKTTQTLSFKFNIMLSLVLFEKNSSPPVKQQKIPLMKKHELVFCAKHKSTIAGIIIADARIRNMNPIT